MFWTVFKAVCSSIPIAGFFAQGELGPVGGQNCIYGFTASVVLFED
jgi:small ligand-binding sensory domain FIST